MTKARPGRKHQPSGHHLASVIDTGSTSSSRGPTTTSQPVARHSLELQTLLRSSNEDGDGHSPRRDEARRNIRPMSRITSLSKSYTTEEERAVVRKFDRKLVLFMALLYMLSFLDRSSQTFNISQCPSCHSPSVSPSASLFGKH